MKSKSLEINVANIMGSELYSGEEITKTVELEDEEDVRFKKPLTVIVELTKAEDCILSDIEIRGEAELECSRCLKKFTHKIIVYADNVFSRGAKEDESKIDDKMNIDILPIIREEIILSLPIKRLCREDCKGLQGK